MSSLLKALASHSNLKKYQRVKVDLNEREFILVMPLDESDTIIAQINATPDMSEELLFNIIKEHNITIESE